MNKKIKQAATISFLLFVLLSCDRPNKATPPDYGAPVLDQSNDDLNDQEASDTNYRHTNDPRMQQDVRALVQGSQNEISFVVTNRRQLKKVTSKTWKYSEAYAVEGEVVSAARPDVTENLVRCHFIDKTKDIDELKKGSEYSLSGVEILNQSVFPRYVFHLSNNKDRASKFINCSTKSNQVFTGFDLQKAFGNKLGLLIYIK